MIAKVLIDTSVKSLNKVYDYLVPEEYKKIDILGRRVLICFGGGKGSLREGIVVKLSDEDPNKDVKYKEIKSVLDDISYIDETRLKLAKWMSVNYFCNVYDAIKLMMPPCSTGKFEHKELNGKQIKVIYLEKSIEEIETHIEQGKVTSARHIKLLRYLAENESIYLDDAVNSLLISKSVIDTVLKNGYIKIEKEDIQNEMPKDIVRTSKLPLTDEQKHAYEGIVKKMEQGKFNTSLIYGVTGSGKTEVYLQLIEKCLFLNKTAIVLVPEISLTAQTKFRFISRFGDMVSVLHSKMTILERQTEIKRIINGQSKIVIGPRSALFVPIKNLGLVIMDEEHDTSYVSSSTPKYNTKEVAAYLTYQTNSTFVLGSATPEVTTMYKAKQGKLDLYTLTKRPTKYDMPEVKLIDMKKDALVSGYKHISSELLCTIKETIERNEQVFLFINRRGFSSSVICKSCGKILKCRNCDVGLTYHRKLDLLLCHYCSYAEKLTYTCPYCKSESLDYGGVGTEKIEEELLELLPGVKVARMDADTTASRGSHEKILQNFREGKTDVLVGTQMISKGHDIPNVTLVGIINADATFAGNSYIAQEKGFSTLLQVSGRAGRGDKKGRVLVQAYDTESYAMHALKSCSYDTFYDSEIEFRKLACYPPFSDIVLLEFTSENKITLYKEANKAYDILNRLPKDNFVFTKPNSPYISKVNNKYKEQIIIKTIINDKVIANLYDFLKEYDKIKAKRVGVSVIKNPTSIG